MSLKTLATVYVLGGLTFLPTLLAIVLGAAWLLLPHIQGAKSDDTKPRRNKEGDGKADSQSSQEYNPDRDAGPDSSGAASATFAVLREYHFPSAVAVLNAKAAPNSAAPSNSNAISDNGNNESTGAASSESVYQSMYRSVFSRNAQQPGSVLEQGSDAASVGDSTTNRLRRKPAVSASVFYIVLRHGHLMLYDSPAQLEVRHVISLAHHAVSLWDGDDGPLPDADLFIKRTAIVLTPLPGLLPNGHHAAQDSFSQYSAPRPFYLFSTTCIEKEDFYHALLSTRTPSPVPQAIAADDLLKLQASLHSTSLTPETRAFNGLIGRIFLSLHRTPYLETLIRSKVEKKIARVQKPSFIASLAVKSIDLGNSAPVLSQPRLKDINLSGDLTLSMDVRYNGGIQLVIAAVAKIDLGTRFKTRYVDLVLATSLQRLSGKMLVRVKPPPSNRIWFCFESSPDMDIKVEPIVSTRQITYTFILRAIEERIRGVVSETLVNPNWDDVPFFDTRSQHIRGGIWSNEGVTEEYGESGDSETDPAATLEIAKDKSYSMPDLLSGSGSTDSANLASGSATPLAKPSASGVSLLKEKAQDLKRRSVASLPLQHSSTMPVSPSELSPTFPSKPLRSPSFRSPSAAAPSVAVNEISGVAVRPNDDVPQPRTWRTRRPPNPASRQAALQAVREMHDKSALAEIPHDPEPHDGESEMERFSADLDSASGRRSLDASRQNSFGWHSRTDSERSQASSNGVASARQQANLRGKNLLAATAAATNAARNWSWNAIANRTARGGGPRQPLFRSARPSAQPPGTPDQPMGRGQPLPPPGTPLPGPQKSLFEGLAGAVGGKGVIKRKPVLPQRRPSPSASESVETDRPSSSSGPPLPARPQKFTARDHDRAHDEHGLGGELVQPDEVEDEFGPWRENSGLEGLSEAEVMESLGHSDEVEAGLAGEDEAAAASDEAIEREADEGTQAVAPPKKSAPPLPARRPKETEEVSSAPGNAEGGSEVKASDEGHEIEDVAENEPSDVMDKPPSSAEVASTETEDQAPAALESTGNPSGPEAGEEGAEGTGKTELDASRSHSGAANG